MSVTTLINKRMSHEINVSSATCGLFLDQTTAKWDFPGYTMCVYCQLFLMKPHTVNASYFLV